MRILLTGGSGFLGMHLISILAHHQVLLFSRGKADFSYQNVSYHNCNLSDTATWKKQVRNFCPDVAIHLAWTGLPDYSFSRCLENFNFSIDLVDVLASTGCKTIFMAGTCWEYGDILGKVKETDIPGPLRLFPSFKTGLRLVSQSIAQRYEVKLIWGRIFFVYGFGQRETSLIPTCYKAIKKGLYPEIKNPFSRHDFIHISDVVGAIKALVETPEVSGIFNLGSGTPNSVSQVYEHIARKLNANFKIPKLQESRKPSGYWADNSLLKMKTGWEPKLSLQEGIEQTIEQWEGA